MTSSQASQRGAPMLKLDGQSQSQMVLAAGNGMSVPCVCVGAVILSAAMGLRLRQVPVQQVQ